MDRQTRIQHLVGHYRNPRHKGRPDDPEISVPGGNPGCGDVVKVHLRADEDGEAFSALGWEGEGCTISMAAASILADRIHRRELSLDDVLDLTYEEMIDLLGRDVVSSRPKCATLALGTLKSAIRRLRSRRRRDAAAGEGEEPSAARISDDEERGLVFGEGAADAAHGRRTGEGAG